MSATVSANPDPAALAARKTASTMTIFGLAVLLAGVAHIVFGPVFPGSPFYWVSALVVIGITTMLLAPVIYYGKMEQLEPDVYGH